jgi:hypothetical protein
MKTVPALLLCLALSPAGAAFASGNDCPNINLHHCCDPPTRFADRWDRSDIDLAITTEEGGVNLVFADGVVAMQLSDRTMHQVRREIRRKWDEDEDNALAQALKSAILSGVQSMLDHSIECPLRELRSVDYRDGRLVFVDRDGDKVFEGIQVDDRDVLESFSERDARAFVAEFHRAQNRR